jgi:hypothetical protein
MYTIEFFDEEDATVDEIIEFIMTTFPQLQFDIYKENISEQLQ